MRVNGWVSVIDSRLSRYGHEGNHCPLCAHARSWLKKHDVDYIERNVSADFGALRAMYQLTRQGLVPVFEANGRAMVRPNDEELGEFLL
jgi:glutaredoxin